MRHLIATALASIILLSCSPSEEVQAPAPRPCDAGDQAFVQRILPLMWGRKPHGAAEIEAWSRQVEAHGRDVVVRAMAEDPAYVARWADWITDALLIARTGDRAYAACFGQPMLSDDQGDLARFIASAPAQSARYREVFNMADVVRSALLADDLSAAWRANLFARMNRPVNGANVAPREMEDNRRTAFGDEFFSAYLGRNLTCLPCHNSEYSITGDEDPARDRTWEVPGLFEKALLGSSYGRDAESAYAPFRYTDLMDDETATLAPWGMSFQCGLFTPPSALTEDFLGQEGYFIEAMGEQGSVWHVETYLEQGVDLLEGAGLTLDEAKRVDGPSAFAWMLGMSLVDQVWLEATGSRLTIANAFPRNQAQMERLRDMTAAFAEARFSLKTLLVQVATDPYFNEAAPSSCEGDGYPLEPVFNPWSPSEEEPARQRNGAGDLVHRHGARTLVRSVHDSLDWPQPAPFLATGDPMATLLTSIGAFMRTSQPGFNGVDFQGALAFEGTYGACQRPSTGGAGDGCLPTPGYGGCASCNCQSSVCAADPYCCDVQWDGLCVSMCKDQQLGGGCGGGLAGGFEDYVDRLLSAATAQGATVGEVVLALKDRLVAQGEVSPEERTLIEALLGTSLDTPLSGAGEVEGKLRIMCGALLISPDYLLADDPGPAAASPRLTLDEDEDCQRMVSLMARVGVTAECGEEAP